MTLPGLLTPHTCAYLTHQATEASRPGPGQVILIRIKHMEYWRVDHRLLLISSVPIVPLVPWGRTRISMVWRSTVSGAGSTVSTHTHSITAFFLALWHTGGHSIGGRAWCIHHIIIFSFFSFTSISLGLAYLVLSYDVRWCQAVGKLYVGFLKRHEHSELCVQHCNHIANPSCSIEKLDNQVPVKWQAKQAGLEVAGLIIFSGWHKPVGGIDCLRSNGA
ncbi:hypothetical protein F5Y15DRAFT_312871 [Xylariaceae sp. FL0016]|nr:hypothetical protein F5Y15DRAFT_312871 [Xylariaceae sp. FL0016]